MTEEEKKEYRKKYYLENRDKILARSRRYKEEHKEELKVKNKLYNKAHEEEIKKWAEEHRESRLATYRKHYQKHRFDRQINKVKAIEYKGSKCSICGCEYDGTNGAIFDFHHTDPKIKDTEISKLLISNNEDKIKLELDKCILICSNCHRLLHNDKY